MKHYTLAELASPEGSRAFLDECEKRENSVCQDIVEKLKRSVQGGTDWSDNELCDIVQKEIDDILRERAEMIETLDRIHVWLICPLLDKNTVNEMQTMVGALLAKVES